MKKLKKESDRKIRLSITLSSEIKNLIDINTSNRSRYIECSLLEHFNKYGLDTTKIKL